MRPSVALLTGATGYLGLHLARHLCAEGTSVHALVRETSDTRRLPAQTFIHRASSDLTGLLGEIQPKQIFHAAAPGGQAGLEEIRQWINLSVDLLEAAQGIGNCRFVLVGSWWQYDSDGRPNPINCYAAAKQLVQTMLERLIELNALDGCAAILFDLYGPDDWRRKLLPLLLQTRGPLPATPGYQQMDMIFIEDAVSGLVACAKQPPGGPTSYTLGTGRRVNVRALADLVRRIMKVPLDIRWGELPYPAIPMTPCPADCPPPGWQAKIDLETGLARIAHNV